MNRLIYGVLVMLLSAPAWAADELPSVTTTQWEIYGFCVLAFAAGVAWVFWYQKKMEKREKRRKTGSSSPA